MRLRLLLPSFLLSLCLATLAYGQATILDTNAIRQDIRQVLLAQTTAWNRGDLTGFMDGYWRSDSLTFANSREVRRGWQGVYANYDKWYFQPKRSGKLAFVLLAITPLAADAALVLGRWQVVKQPGEAPEQGHFTLLFRLIQGRWVIVLDHTS
jgi:ketosteroid isomerase-like protein